MKIGTKSLLFGGHHWLWHPLLVLVAWVHLYGAPNFKTLICIFVHDWGYWGCPNIDGPEGSAHPVRGAKLIAKLFGTDYAKLCLFHSRTFSSRFGRKPSKLCWADKLSFCLEPRWFYLLRARLSGELKEYRALAALKGWCPAGEADSVWYEKIKACLYAEVENERGAERNEKESKESYNL
jgi:hypothetical protein